MKTSSYRDRWSALLTDHPDRDDLRRLSERIARRLLDDCLNNRRYEDELIDLLCEMGTFSEDSELTGPATGALFGIVIESLCDAFDPFQTEIYYRVMTRVISYCRRLPAAQQLDRQLKDFGIYRSHDLLDRFEQIKTDPKLFPPDGRVHKILVLSRATIGADVAITSVIIRGLAQAFPGKEIVVIGKSKLKEIFGGNPRITIRDVSYSKTGGLLSRLATWPAVLHIIEEELAASPPDKTILVDPDSRFSQLGILPLISPQNYFFLDSRSADRLNREMSMAELTNLWFNRLTGEDNIYYPQLWLPESYQERAARFYNKLRENGVRRIIAVNFGVGGNPRKKVGRIFEEKLLLTLLEEPDTVVLLDEGFGEEEEGEADSLIQAMGDQGYPIFPALNEREIDLEMKRGIIGIRGNMGETAALIAKSNEFIGYDSACQHIAAALKIPCLTVFAGSNNPRFIRRWSAYGPGSCYVVQVDTLTDPARVDVDEIIGRIKQVRARQTHLDLPEIRR